MKFKVKATVEFEWEEDTESWGEHEDDDVTIETALEDIEKYITEDHGYLFESEIKLLSVKKVDNG